MPSFPSRPSTLHKIHTMTLPDDFDPDNNYAEEAEGAEIDNDAGAEALVWQLLLAINPGDEDAALQQFSAFQEALGGDAPDDADVASLLRDVTDWRSGFHVEEADTGTLVDCLTQLAARFNLEIDWDVEDPTDADWLDGATTTALLETAYDQLRLDGYTLWTWDTGTSTVAGWMTLTGDNEAIRVLAPALGIEARPAGR